MSIYVIADLHLSFNDNKPMDIFGDNWKNHYEKIKENWIKRVNDNDTVIIPGDFSWAMNIKDTYEDFKFLNSLPGKKILLKGNHDYWWTTLKKMNEYILANNFINIEFIYNTSVCCENSIITGTRGWAINDEEEDRKMIKRENARLKLAIEDGIKKFGNDKEIIVFMHYPPIVNEELNKNPNLDFYQTLKEYNIKKCYYGHLHANSHKSAVIGNVDGIEFKLISADYLKFDLEKVK